MPDNVLDKENTKGAYLNPQGSMDTYLYAIYTQIKEDFHNAEQDLGAFHKKVKEMRSAYNNVEDYVSLRKENKFPVPFMQKHVDQIVAYIQDKIWHTNEPCTMIGREEQDKPHIEAKQAMMNYQDEQDNVYSKIGQLIRDCVLHRICAAQVDYGKDTRKKWIEDSIPAYVFDESGMPIIDPETNQPVVQTDISGQPVSMGSRWVQEEIIDFCGARTKRIDLLDLFFPCEKMNNEDDIPVMVRSYQSLDYFYSQDYFFNQEFIDKNIDQKHKHRILASKEENTGLMPASYSSRKPHDYIEWQGKVDKGKLYNWMANSSHHPEITEIIPFKLYMETWGESRDIIEIKEREKCWAIVGMVDDEIIVRMDVSPFNVSNVIIGSMSTENEYLIGLGPGQKIEAIHKGMQDLMGMMIENFKQIVNAGWVIWEDMLKDKNVKANKPGVIFKTIADVNNTVKRLEQQIIAPDIHTIMAYFEQWGQDADGLQDTLTGKGDRGVETLGEANQVMVSAALRMRDYLKSFEESFIKPLWRLRNDINSAYIDQDYAYRVIGKKGLEWRKITPAEIRTSVDFICQSSSRETQRAVLIQQILELGQIAPLALQAGQPVRIDLLGAELCRVGFNWSENKIKQIWPLIGLEAERGQPEINQMLAENALLAQAMQRLQMMMGMGMGGGQAVSTGQQLPQPTTESDAIKSMNKRNEPNI